MCVCVCGGGGGGDGEQEIFFFLKGGTENLVTFLGGTENFYESQSNSRSPPDGKK